MKLAGHPLLHSRLMQAVRLPLLALAAPLALSCAHYKTVTVPPIVDLTEYRAVGVIEFASVPEGDLGMKTTRRFLDDLRAAQPGTTIVALGPRAKILKDLGYGILDSESVKAIGERFHVSAVAAGAVEFSKVKPGGGFETDLKYFAAGVDANVEGHLNVELWNTATGATDWANSSWGRWSLGGIRFDNDGSIAVNTVFPSGKKDQMISDLVNGLNGDFWPRKEWLRVRE